MSETIKLYTCKKCGSTRWNVRNVGWNKITVGIHAQCNKCYKVDYDVSTSDLQIVRG